MMWSLIVNGLVHELTIYKSNRTLQSRASVGCRPGGRDTGRGLVL
jgi:hypothetical protein